jgi:hypothetical protein
MRARTSQVQNARMIARHTVRVVDTLRPTRNVGRRERMAESQPRHADACSMRSDNAEEVRAADILRALFANVA